MRRRKNRTGVLALAAREDDPLMPTSPERSVRVSTLELFFDLVFVFTITQLTGVLVDGGHPAAFVQVVVMLLLIWWTYDAYAGSRMRSPPTGPSSACF